MKIIKTKYIAMTNIEGQQLNVDRIADGAKPETEYLAGLCTGSYVVNISFHIRRTSGVNDRQARSC